MSDANNTGYAGWQWLAMEETEQAALTELKGLFNAVASKAGVDGYVLDIQKARLTINTEEGRSGAFHQLAGGEPFYRISLTAPANSGMEGVMTFMMLSQAFAANGGASVSMGNPAVMTLDRREPLQTVVDVTRLLPQAVDMVRKPQ